MSLIKFNNNQPDLFSGFMDRFFDDFGTDFYRSTPAVNISETENEYTLEVAAPGLKREDFNLNIDHTILTISAEKKVENTEDKDKYKRREFSYTSFKRSFTLPNSVDLEGIEAKYEEGVLNLTVPKKGEVKPRTIEVL